LRLLHRDLPDLPPARRRTRFSPRGRIYQIKDMLEGGKPATPDVVKHVDRCLSCLSCMTTCPSGVHYMHLVDHARAHIEETYEPPGRRPPHAAGHRSRRCCRYPGRFRLAMLAARLGEAADAGRSAGCRASAGD
jgi:glycolate oxidase iron-sulfur subunit